MPQPCAVRMGVRTAAIERRCFQAIRFLMAPCRCEETIAQSETSRKAMINPLIVDIQSLWNHYQPLNSKFKVQGKLHISNKLKTLFLLDETIFNFALTLFIQYIFMIEDSSNKSNKSIVLEKMEKYLKQYPSASAIEHFQHMFKLTYTFSSPFTDSKHPKEVYLPKDNVKSGHLIQNKNKKIAHNAQKGRIQEVGTFDSIMTKGKHEKVFQDDVFGKAQSNSNGSKWVYAAEIKQEEVKSYFGEGKGKLPYRHDFGETYDNVKESGIFVWDKTKKKVFRIPIKENLIPCHPSFSNQEGTQIMFHAYERASSIQGMIFCFNRIIKVFKASFIMIEKEKQASSDKKQSKDKEEVKADIEELFTTDMNTTKIFPKVSPCFNYLIYLSGTGKTHTFYKDLVICKKRQSEWVQTHRFKEKIIGYNSTLRTYMIEEDGKVFGITQTNEKSCSQIYRIDLETGQLVNLSQCFPNYDFQITSIDENIIVGGVTTNNFNSFFWIQKGKTKIIDPPSKENFCQQEYESPIHSVLISAKEEDIWPEYQFRVKNRPLCVMPHGGPHGSFARALTSMRYMMLKMGYYCLHPNFSGSTGYGQKFLEASLGKVGQKDAQEIIQTLKKVLEDHPNIDKGKVHTQGGSYGGYMSAILASRYSQYFKSAIIFNGVIDLISNLWFADIPEWNTVEGLAKSSLHDLTPEDYQALWRQSPSSQSLKIPTLQFLGGKDRRVPYRQGLFLDAITKEKGVSITTYVYENSGHSLSDSVETVMDTIIKVLLFLESHDEQNPYKELDEGKEKEEK